MAVQCLLLCLFSFLLYHFHLLLPVDFASDILFLGLITCAQELAPQDLNIFLLRPDLEVYSSLLLNYIGLTCKLFLDVVDRRQRIVKFVSISPTSRVTTMDIGVRGTMVVSAGKLLVSGEHSRVKE